MKTQIPKKNFGVLVHKHLVYTLIQYKLPFQGGNCVLKRNARLLKTLPGQFSNNEVVWTICHFTLKEFCHPKRVASTRLMYILNAYAQELHNAFLEFEFSFFCFSKSNFKICFCCLVHAEFIKSPRGSFQWLLHPYTIIRQHANNQKHCSCCFLKNPSPVQMVTCDLQSVKRNLKLWTLCLSRN